MVATSRLRGAQANMENFRPYASKFSEVLGSLAQKSGEEASPLLVPREEVKETSCGLVYLGSGVVWRL
jgi:F-type H+-transporting ATPase subunit gamma